MLCSHFNTFDISTTFCIFIPLSLDFFPHPLKSNVWTWWILPWLTSMVFPKQRHSHTWQTYSHLLYKTNMATALLSISPFQNFQVIQKIFYCFFLETPNEICVLHLVVIPFPSPISKSFSVVIFIITSLILNDPSV